MVTRVKRSIKTITYRHYVSFISFYRALAYRGIQYLNDFWQVYVVHFIKIEIFIRHVGVKKRNSSIKGTNWRISEKSTTAKIQRR